MMDMMMRPMRAEEQKYTYAQSQQLRMQAGAIGYLRGDFGQDGGEFHTTWFNEVESRKTEEFKAEFDEVINALRFDERYGGLLAGRMEMRECGRRYPDSGFPDTGIPGVFQTKIGFRVDTDQFAYLLRCDPSKGDYNFYCWCYEEKWLDRHIQKARNGIRFITPDYKEKFRIPDGDQIRIMKSDGSQMDQLCRYIDDYHVELDGWGSLYHICQLAELLERNGSTVIPMRSDLPELCFTMNPETAELSVIRHGEDRFRRSKVALPTEEDYRRYADKRNRDLHITKAQEAAMCGGVLYGWDAPEADPKNYDENGHLLKPKQKERGEAR